MFHYFYRIYNHPDRVYNMEPGVYIDLIDLTIKIRNYIKGDPVYLHKWSGSPIKTIEHPGCGRVAKPDLRCPSGIIEPGMIDQVQNRREYGSLECRENGKDIRKPART